MKAVRLSDYGGQLVFSDVPAPEIARDEILVKIKSTAVNHLDLVKFDAGPSRSLRSVFSLLSRRRTSGGIRWQS